MTAAKLADTSDPRFTDDQRATLARFEAAVTPPEIVEARVVEEVARAMAGREIVVMGYRQRTPMTADGILSIDEARRLAAAAVAVYRAAQDGGAEEALRRVEALVRADHPRMIAAHEVRDALHGGRRGHGASEGDPSL